MEVAKGIIVRAVGAYHRGNARRGQLTRKGGAGGGGGRNPS